MTERTENQMRQGFDASVGSMDLGADYCYTGVPLVLLTSLWSLTQGTTVGVYRCCCCCCCYHINSLTKESVVTKSCISCLLLAGYPSERRGEILIIQAGDIERLSVYDEGTIATNRNAAT